MSNVRSILASIWIGWYRDFSWTNPLLGLSLRTIPPIASVMAASIVYWWGSFHAGVFDPNRLAYIMIGALLYAHIAAYSMIPNLAIAEGKWTFVFTQVYMSPKSASPYLAGRTLGSFLSSAVTLFLALIAVYLLLPPLFGTSIPLVVTPLSFALFGLALVVNILASMGIGFLLGAYAIFATKFEWALPTYISGLLMIFSEALFPVTFLPGPLSQIANVLPFTEFIRAARAAMIYNDVSSYFYFLGLSAIGGLILLFAGLLAFRRAENRARRLGLLDRKVA
ncbi:hypothetical protein AUG19_03110 [archaeon 13_1_20CM_2_54_9]|nr:MAG: hypothetical protein AUJ07_11020 [Crenarchaeota archaeon 13_1_40CM_3_53_5]OLE76471.1 MAG: hypothetical protein AUG19_03110 [archaeon 13_1_20CM_2_54_9]TMI20757.1 MAG: hypothetical protein E6H36_12805 [Candidatus Bathyarchaeota archaeon]TMI32472.1 MAG: hypothetical protein E6H29_02145 [Candidatus Bathyarchaeota archaeon]